VGLSDFKVDLAIADTKNPNRAVLGILLDGQRWSQRRTVTDRDALPVSMLVNRMGWAGVERIWLPNWLRSPESEIARVKASFEKALLEGPRVTKKATQVKSSEPIFTRKTDLADERDFRGVNPFDSLLKEIPTWSPLGPKIIGAQQYLDYLHDKQIQGAVRDIVSQLTAHEGPVSSERLAKFVASCFGFNRVVSGRIAAINGVGFPGHVRDKEQFLYPAHQNPETYSEWRKSPAGSGRSIQDVSIREIKNAMISIARVAQGVEQEELLRETSRVFGVQKMSKDIATRLESALKSAISVGELMEDKGYLKPRS
jgi:hypothetical protein